MTDHQPTQAVATAHQRAPTLRYSATFEPCAIKLGGRSSRVLQAVANGPLQTADVCRAARKKPRAPIARENPATRECLRKLRQLGLVAWSSGVATITDHGRLALAMADFGTSAAHRREGQTR